MKDNPTQGAKSTYTVLTDLLFKKRKIFPPHSTSNLMPPGSWKPLEQIYFTGA